MAKEAKNIRITEGSSWSEGMEGEVFETYGTVESMDGIYYFVDPDSNTHRRLVSVDNCEVVDESATSNMVDSQADRIESVCNEVRDLLIRKNHDYGDSFSKQFEKYGVLSGMIRMDDKMRRLETLIGGEEAQVAESIEDTVADLAGYALLTLVELRIQRNRHSFENKNGGRHTDGNPNVYRHNLYPGAHSTSLKANQSAPPESSLPT
jgi:Nucleotide modification associated domain 1